MKKPVVKTPAHGAPVPKAKTTHHVKPVHVTAAVKAKRHAAAVKASKTRAANAKKAKQHPRRQLAAGSGVACCSAEALAASLRLAGVPVSDADVLALYWRTADDEDAGASILATLEAAAEFGLAGRRPCFVDGFLADRDRPDGFLDREGGIGPHGGFKAVEDGRPGARDVHALILGISDPAPHAVLATPDGWWSWGELYDPWTDDIDEAWEVTWPGTR